jgi:uncharacterized protein (TIGR00661 family)
LLNILVAPLDWGLGHATRCVPLIRHLIHKGHRVTVAGEGPIMALLQQEFPKIETVQLKGYRIRYPYRGRMFLLKMVWQLPKIALAIRSERTWLKKHHERWNLVISDNRYGLAVSKVPAVLITHQPSPISGLGTRADRLLSRLLYRWIEQFNACWIPDEATERGIAGQLSHPGVLPNNSTYTGPLSRLQTTCPEEKGTILVLLSGPEPQRSLLEKALLNALKTRPEKIRFVRGLPSAETASSSIESKSERMCIENHLDAAQLSEALSKAEIVICRSGYSSVMDLLKLRKKAILVPTPGQTEQLYIADHLEKKGWFVVQQQKALSIEEGINQAHKITPEKWPQFNFEGYKQAFSQLGIQ